VEGKSYVYRAAVAREKIEKKAVKSLLQRFFGGSAEALVLRLIEDEHLTPEQIDELKKIPRKRPKGRRKGGAR
jgi:predicted transcriptional regulator